MKHNLIGIAGPARSGKDTLGHMIAAALPAPSIFRKFADPLKKIVADVFDMDFDQVEGHLKDAPDPRYIRQDGVALTPRHAMQTLGTEWGRHCYPDVWIDYLLRKAAEDSNEGAFSIVTDVRFPNELEALVSRGMPVIRVTRPGVSITESKHSSENALSDINPAVYFAHVENAGTLAELEAQAKGIAQRITRLMVEGMHDAMMRIR